jgi:EF-hand domain pair/EF hand
MYLMNKLMILSGVALLGLAGGAIAQPQGQGPDRGPRRGADVTRAAVIQRSDAAFARLDANHDGRFTREEARALGAQRRQQMQTQMFERIDADHNGQISREEFAQGRGRGPGMRGPGGPGGPGAMADGGPDGPPPPGGPGMRRGFRHGGPGMRMRMGARMFGDAGFVTAEQFRARALERFDRADANHDGTLTAAERQAVRGEMRRHRRPGGPDMPPPPQPAQ